MPDYDQASMDETRQALLSLARNLQGYDRMFGSRDEVDPVRHLIGTAAGWGGLPTSEAVYPGVDPRVPPGFFNLTLRDVPADAFWSISVYNAAGFFEPNASGRYTLNSITAERDGEQPDGPVTVRFAPDDSVTGPNALPIPGERNDGTDLAPGIRIPARAGNNGRVRLTSPPRVPIRREIWILVGSAFVIAIGYGIISPVLPAYARSFDVGVAAASVIVSAFAFFRLVFAPAGGELVSRLGERPVYLTGLLVVAASSLATAFAQSYVQLLVFRGLGGIGSTMFTISAMALLVRLAPPSARGRVSSAYGSAFLIGGMIGPALGGLLAGWGMRAPFVVYAVALALAAAVVAIGLGGARLRPAHDGATREVMSLAEAWRSPVYRAVLASGVANGWTNFGVRMAVLPLLATAVLDEPWVAGTALAIGAAGTAATLQVSGRMADRVGRRPLVIGGLLLMGVTMALLGLAQHPSLSVGRGLGLLFGLSLLSGVGAGFVNPGQQAAVADVIGHERNGGRVLSTFQMAQDGGAIVGPILTGLVADLLGFGTAFLVTGLVCILGAMAWLPAPEPLVHHAPDTVEVGEAA